MDKILPCPFCGEDEDLCTDSAHAPDEGFVVACCVCNAMGPNCESSLGAVRGWNDRRALSANDQHNVTGEER